MDATGWTLVIGAIVSGIIAVMKGYADMRKNLMEARAAAAHAEERCDETSARQDTLWHSTVNRGYVEAVQLELLSRASGKWIVAQRAMDHYTPKRALLSAIRRRLAERLGRSPSEYELGEAILSDQDVEAWLLGTICPALGLHAFGCVAIACEVSKLNGLMPLV